MFLDFLDEDGTFCNTQLITSLFNDRDATVILSIPLSCRSTKDNV